MIGRSALSALAGRMHDRDADPPQHVCFYCGADVWRPGAAAQVDHRAPPPRGGHRLEDRLPACRACRQSKGDLTLAEYRERVREQLPEWRTMLALSAVLAGDERLARPSAFRLLWACAAKAGGFRFPGEALGQEQGLQDSHANFH